jgi:hypothetical protein
VSSLLFSGYTGIFSLHSELFEEGECQEGISNNFKITGESRHSPMISLKVSYIEKIDYFNIAHFYRNQLLTLNQCNISHSILSEGHRLIEPRSQNFRSERELEFCQTSPTSGPSLFAAWRHVARFSMTFSDKMHVAISLVWELSSPSRMNHQCHRRSSSLLITPAIADRERHVTCSVIRRIVFSK